MVYGSPRITFPAHGWGIADRWLRQGVSLDQWPLRFETVCSSCAIGSSAPAFSAFRGSPAVDGTAARREPDIQSLDEFGTGVDVTEIGG